MSSCLFNLLFLTFNCPSLCSSRKRMLVWKQNWQRWSWLRSRERLRLALQTTPSPVSYGRSTLLTPSSQTVSGTFKHEVAHEKVRYTDTHSHFLAGAHNTPSLWAGTNGGCVFAYMLRLPAMEHRADEAVTAHPGERNRLHSLLMFMFGQRCQLF